MQFSTSRKLNAAALALALASAGACVDGTPLMPGVEDPPAVASRAMQCQVDVRAETMACTTSDPSQNRLSIAANRIVGGQDVYVKLTSTGASYDAGTEIFQINVTVQNLTQAALGTSDGSTVDGVNVFFSQGPIAFPSGSVTVANATGTAFFTDPDQPYFHYAQILQPYEISNALSWQFNVAPTVTNFTFLMYVSAPQPDEMMPLLDRVWQGNTSSDWAVAANWRDGLVPDSANAVAVPSDSLMVGTFAPALTADAELTHLRVGSSNTLDLAGFTLTAWGNVDAPGAITNGVLHLGGPTSLLRGNVPAVVVNAATRLQGATVASGPVSVSDGSLTVSGTPLSISVP